MSLNYVYHLHFNCLKILLFLKKNLQKHDALQLDTEAAFLNLISFKEFKSPKVHFISVVSTCCLSTLDLYLISQQFCHRDLASSLVKVYLYSLSSLSVVSINVGKTMNNLSSKLEKKCKLTYLQQMNFCDQ